jgi:superfamily II DNA or RNA helicase
MNTLTHEPVVLRDYQQDTVRSICLAAKGGARRITVALPTGAGKTEVFAELCRIARFPLVIAPLIELMRQARDRLQLRLGEGCDIEQGANFAEWIEGLRRRVIVGSRDSLLSGDRYKMAAYDRVTLVVVDECHIGTTPAFERLLNHFESRGATIVGFSATPFKKKGKALRYWPRPEISYGMADFIRQGWLVGPTCHLSESKAFDLTLVDEVAHEWDQRQLAAVLTGEHFAQEISSLVLQTHARMPSVIYAGKLKQLYLLQDVFARYGCRVAVVHSRQNEVERAANMEAFRCGDAKIIINVGVLSCGWDHPEVRNIYFAAPQRSLSRYEQRLGRGTRPLPGVLKPGMTLDERLAAIAASDKPTFHVYDITDSSRNHQILNALDVLDAKTRKSKARRERVASAIGSEGVNAMDAIAAQDAHDLAELEAKTAAIIEKRKRLIVGVTFDHTTRDLFAAPTGPKKRGWRMLYGKYEGVPLTDIPADYLSWVLNSTKKESPFKSAVRRELVARKTKGK